MARHKQLRLFRLARILRAVRVFRSLTPLRILITALFNATLPVVYSFVLMFLVVSTFAVVATDSFSEVLSVWTDRKIDGWMDR